MQLSSAPWWAWVLVALAASTVISVLIGKALARASAAYPPSPAAPPALVANRRRLDRDLPVALGRGPVGFLVVDVDHFTTYRETHGQDAGDDALRRIATVLSAQVRPTDIVYRYRGDQLCVLLADATPPEASLVAERIRAGVEATDFPGAESQPAGRITVSVGLVVAEAANADELTERADRALDAAKHGGRNRVEVSVGG